ncbi:MAG TPA: hypothetical protein VF306_05120, partial [Pirellulales bacterium]
MQRSTVAGQSLSDAPAHGISGYYSPACFQDQWGYSSRYNSPHDDGNCSIFGTLEIAKRMLNALKLAKL